MVFDCDGVILDSNNLKTQAFSEAIKGEPQEKIELLLLYHKEHGGVSRYHKFKHYFEKINPQENSEEKIIKATTRFAEIVHNGLKECNFIPGVLSFIRRVNALNSNIFVVTGSDENELKDVFADREIDELFEMILGSPVTKYEHMINVIDLVGKDAKGIYFGDSKLDMDVAESFGLDFVFVKGYTDWHDWAPLINSKGYIVIDDFSKKNTDYLSGNRF